ncbi:MAG: SRPBCC family protein [Povalibacter sp.]
MASIYREFEINASAEAVWDVIRDVGAIHERFAKGFVVNTVLEGAMRTVTFANGFVVREEIVAIDHQHRRLAYRAVGGRATHHNASFQVFEISPTRSSIRWITDLLPDEVQSLIEPMVDQGVVAIRATLEQS